MDIPELVRGLLILKLRLKDGADMSIHINKSTISVQMWIGNSERWLRTMNLCDWLTKSRDFLSECWSIARDYNLLDKQEFLPFQ